jgi:glutathione S-transferase
MDSNADLLKSALLRRNNHHYQTGKIMKLYFHPVSTVSRPIMLFAAEHGVNLDYQLVDIFSGEHMQESFGKINPSHMVPVLEDGDFRLTECSAILKYLADKIAAPSYPSELRARARVNERMDWFNTGLYRDFGYGFVYPQTFPNHQRPDTAVNSGIVAWAKEKSQNWLRILDQDLIGAQNDFVCGKQITIADYLGAGIVSLGDIVRVDFACYPSIKRWMDGMKARPSWAATHDAFDANVVRPFANAVFERL